MNNQDKQRQSSFYIGKFIMGQVLPLGLLLGICTSQISTLAQLSSAATTSYSRNQALYVTMRDGTKVAIDVWLPKDLSPSTKIPTIMRSTRYWRVFDFVDNNLEKNQYSYKEAEAFNNFGYAVVSVDARGTGASFGRWSSPGQIKKLKTTTRLSIGSLLNLGPITRLAL